MGKEIIRSNAIKLLWKKASEIGLNSDQIHDILQGWVDAGFIKHASITQMENPELALFMNKVLETNVFIKDDKITSYIKSIIKHNPELEPKLQGILRRYKMLSLYQMSMPQKRFLVGYILKNSE